MTKSISVLLLILLSIPLISAEEDISRKIYHSQYLVLDSTLTTKIKIQPQNGGARLEAVGAEINFFPRETKLQKILERRYTPEAEPLTRDGDVLNFVWPRPEAGIPLELEMKTKLRVNNNPTRITKKVPFPFPTQSLPEKVQQYTQLSKIINSNPAIIRLASQLAEGEDDMVVVVDKAAAWVTQNIQYNLSTATADATQPATWVLEHKEGVCDELTSLFSAILRSLKIPVRFVAGISYTNSDLFQNKWGPHGWAEVYFPEYGWIPYDVTYGEYGYVDPSHIFSKESLDAEKITSRFNWRGKDIDLDIGEFTAQVNIVEYGPEVEEQLDIDVELEKGAVGFGSYNLIKATARNLRDYYQSFDLHLAKTTKLEIVGDAKQHVLLKPGEEKNLFWIVKLQDDLEKNFIYTFPISVYTTGNISDKKMFKAIEGGLVLSEEKVKKKLETLKQGPAQEKTSELSMQCKSRDASLYVGEETMIICIVTNQGNTLLQSLNVCLEQQQCKREEIGITQSKSVQLVYQGKTQTPGKQELVITATSENPKIEEEATLELSVLDKPVVLIENLMLPEHVNYDENYVITFGLKKASTANPKKLVVKIEANHVEKEFTIDELIADQPFQIEYVGNDLASGENTVQVKVIYEGEKKDSFVVTAEKVIVLENLNFWQKVQVFFGTLGNAVMDVLT
ncbi:TPA: hypothetical protein HA249_03105 [Candidatus Woesearchaeota archaeon]|nr:hypothetical protein [Candidatus Woesearchaeota archaeon]HIH47739.1 hypothetical protein [Candidatus Woesearchaeota archaeon]HII88828.1 hypothetical protein [Candidatus Woesearchaeota archaeon]